MKKWAYYNDSDPFVCEWARNLIKAGVVPDGEVDCRSIADVSGDDVRGFAQAHFFCGILGWPYALDLAGWGDRSVWTGSCPCQPFSSAGKRAGYADERDLWPAWFRLIQECRPPVIFGEQVASSTVVGSVDEQDEDVQAVLDRQTVLGILREFEGLSAPNLQGVRSGRGAGEEARIPRSCECAAQKMASREPGLSVNQCSETSGEDSGITLRPKSAGYPAENRRGILRTDGDCLQSRRAACLERAVIGSTRSRDGLYAPECAGSFVCPECHGECVGRGPHCGNCQCDFCSSAREIERLIQSDSRAAQAEITWLARIRSDLERIGYAFGACVAPACSAGAPHIRQRLFWGARSSSASGGLADARRECHESRRRIGDVSRAAEVAEGQARQRQRSGDAASNSGATGGMGDADRR